MSRRLGLRNPGAIYDVLAAIPESLVIVIAMAMSLMSSVIGGTCQNDYNNNGICDDQEVKGCSLHSC